MFHPESHTPLHGHTGGVPSDKAAAVLSSFCEFRRVPARGVASETWFFEPPPPLSVRVGGQGVASSSHPHSEGGTAVCNCCTLMRRTMRAASQRISNPNPHLLPSSPPPPIPKLKVKEKERRIGSMARAQRARASDISYPSSALSSSRATLHCRTTSEGESNIRSDAPAEHEASTSTPLNTRGRSRGAGCRPAVLGRQPGPCGGNTRTRAPGCSLGGGLRTVPGWRKGAGVSAGVCV
eukprot:scaffold3960_cov116-Isochrysis_galbana.AAC.5